MTENKIFLQEAEYYAHMDELERYRAIGTVEELQQHKEYIDTINKICSGYSAVGTIEEFKALKEKNEPKRANVCGDGYYDGHLVYDEYSCPNCGKIYELEYEEYEYCTNCGQHMKSELEQLDEIAEQMKGGA